MKKEHLSFYESPLVQVIDMKVEGVLCISDVSVEDWSYDEDEI